jgi:hypothetical protein
MIMSFEGERVTFTKFLIDNYAFSWPMALEGVSSLLKNAKIVKRRYYGIQRRYVD